MSDLEFLHFLVSQGIYIILLKTVKYAFQLKTHVRRDKICT